MKVKIGSLELQNPFIAGPMAKISHIGLRKIINDFGGAGLLFTEMLDARKLLHEELKDNPATLISGTDIPTFYQIFVADPLIAKMAVNRLIHEIGAIGIDINMGCPAPFIRQQQSGVMLMKDTDNTFRIIEAIRMIYKGPLTAKIRTGYKNILNTIEFSRGLENAGIDAIIFHPRLFNQKLKAKAKWEYISELKASLNIPVIGNGDILTAKEAIMKLELYKPDFVMISRLSAKEPWVFSKIHALLNHEEFISPDLINIWNQYFETVSKYYVSRKAMEYMVRWTEYFSKNFKFGHEFWRLVKNAETLENMTQKANAFIKRNLKELIRS